MILVQLIFMQLIVCYCSIRNENLVALIQVFRHGQRNPIELYPTDPYKNRWDQSELAQITKVGRRQLYELGKYTRNRYSDWIPLNYSRNFIYAQTTNVERTHISGQSFLYGLFPATGNQKWLPTTDWQAIPLHQANPKILWQSSQVCPKYDALYNQLPFINELDKKYAELYSYLANYTGQDIHDIYLHSAEVIYDTLLIEDEMGLVLPDWTKSVYPEPLTTLYGDWLKSLTYSNQLKRFYVGPLLKHILTFFKTMTVNPSASPKFQVYSAHDDNIVSILNSFGAYDKPYPYVGFGASLWIELRNNTKGYYVNVWLKNNDGLKQIEVGGCGMDCSLEKTEDVVKDIAIDLKTWVKECYTE